MEVIGITVDTYKGYHYYVCAVTDRSTHKKPYIAVDKNDHRVAWIDIKEGKVNFYSSTPSEVQNDLSTLEIWFSKNENLSIKLWNQVNPKYGIE